MQTKTEVWNSYLVDFVFDYTVISGSCIALHEDAAPMIAANLICDELGISSEILDQAQDIRVELMDTDVL